MITLEKGNRVRVAINPRQVRFVTERANGTTAITFGVSGNDDDQNVTVTAPFDEVVDQIAAALEGQED